MIMLAGLGNPGEEYRNTRHNAGFLFVDYLYQHAEEVIKPWKYDKYINANLAVITLNQNITLLKPHTFMNLSGQSIKNYATRYELGVENIYVAHDDLDLRLGNFKIQNGIGPKMHNGISSIEDALGSKDFWRIRIGIDKREESNDVSGEAYVLSKFSVEEKEKLIANFDFIYERLLLTIG
jgi:peptidyl-tRNA hydrolase, PTH1 family